MELRILHKAALIRDKIRVVRKTEKKTKCEVTTVRLTGDVNVGTRDGWLCFWVAGREVRVGPLTPDQAEKLAEDLEYEAAQ